MQRSKVSTGKLSLDDLLIKPVQRIPRYLLFIKDLLKHTSASHPDHAPLTQALDELTGLAERVNESERGMARTEKQRELLASVDGLALVLITPVCRQHLAFNFSATSHIFQEKTLKMAYIKILFSTISVYVGLALLSHTSV